MLRFGDGIGQYTSASDRLPVARTVKVQIDQVRMVDTEVGRVPGASPFHSDSHAHPFTELIDDAKQSGF